MAQDETNLPGSGWKPWVDFGAPWELIGRPGNPEYLWRCKVWRWFGIEGKFHWFRGSDPDDLHDHPWWFVSVMLAGCYRETWLDRRTGRLRSKLYRAPRIRFCRAEHRHSVQVPFGPCLTFVISGRRTRRWGFWIDCVNGAKRFIYWRAYDGTHKC